MIMKGYDPDLFRKVKEAVSMQQVAEYYGLQLNRKGLCQCPFHQDKNPSLKIYPDGKDFTALHAELAAIRSSLQHYTAI